MYLYVFSSTKCIFYISRSFIGFYSISSQLAISLQLFLCVCVFLSHTHILITYLLPKYLCLLPQGVSSGCFRFPPCGLSPLSPLAPRLVSRPRNSWSPLMTCTYFSSPYITYSPPPRLESHFRDFTIFDER